MRKACIVAAVLFTSIATWRVAFVRTSHIENTEKVDRSVPIEFNKQSHDFGVVSVGSNLSFSFRYRNNLNRPVTIKEVLTSCGCLATTNQFESVGSSETGIIDLSLSLKGRLAPVVAVQHALVKFDDPSVPSVRLELKADVREDVRLSKRSLTFDEISEGVFATQDISVFNVFLNDETFRSDVKLQAYGGLKVVEVSRDERCFVCMVSVVDSGIAGSEGRAALKIGYTVDGDVRTVVVPVKVRRKSSAFASPSKYSIHARGDSASWKVTTRRRIEVQDSDGRQLRVVRILNKQGNDVLGSLREDSVIGFDSDDSSDCFHAFVNRKPLGAGTSRLWHESFRVVCTDNRESEQRILFSVSVVFE